MKKLIVLVLIGACAVLTGCASMFGDNDHRVAVNSNPSGAEVYYNGQAVGRTPTKVAIGSAMNTNAITVKKENYESQSRQVETSFQTIGILNVLFWPGFIVDALTGDMQKITSKNMNFNLHRAHA